MPANSANDNNSCTLVERASSCINRTNSCLRNKIIHKQQGMEVSGNYYISCPILSRSMTDTRCTSWVLMLVFFFIEFIMVQMASTASTEVVESALDIRPKPAFHKNRVLLRPESTLKSKNLIIRKHALINCR